MTVTVGINGFGRIGRCTLAHIAEASRNDVQVVKINATGPIETNAHLLKYDSVHGRFGGPVKVSGNTLDLGRGPIEVMSTYNPEELDWDGVDVVLECTGKFNDRDKAAVHLTRGAKRVLVSAPAKRADKTVVYGVNHRELRPEHLVVSNGSCTTNCLAPLAKVLNDAIGIESGIMTTIHSYTGDQPATTAAATTDGQLDSVAATATAMFAGVVATPECHAPEWWVSYVTLEGDTIDTLATTRGILPEELIVANCLAGPDLAPGTQLQLPPVGVIVLLPGAVATLIPPTATLPPSQPTRRPPLALPTPTFPVIIVIPTVQPIVPEPGDPTSPAPRPSRPAVQPTAPTSPPLVTPTATPPGLMPTATPPGLAATATPPGLGQATSTPPSLP